MKTLSVEDLNQRKDDFELIDVRENHEREGGHIGGKHIPMSTLQGRESEIPKDKEVVIYCRSGNRSGNVVMYLQQQGYENLYNLEGGMLAWKDRIDPNMNVV